MDHLRRMMRIRALVAVLGCLAVLASAFTTVAAASVPVSAPVTERASEDAPCTHCDECDTVPCPIPAAACMQASSTAAPALAAALLALPAMGFDKIRWSLRKTSLSGLSPPPDPFPPRA